MVFGQVKWWCWEDGSRVFRPLWLGKTKSFMLWLGKNQIRVCSTPGYLYISHGKKEVTNCFLKTSMVVRFHCESHNDLLSKLTGVVVTSEVTHVLSVCASAFRPSQTARLPLKKNDPARTQIVVIMFLFKGASILQGSPFESTAGWWICSLSCVILSFFLSLFFKTRPNHWTQRMVNIWLTTEDPSDCTEPEDKGPSSF